MKQLTLEKKKSAIQFIRAKSAVRQCRLKNCVCGFENWMKSGIFNDWRLKRGLWYPCCFKRTFKLYLIFDYEAKKPSEWTYRWKRRDINSNSIAVRNRDFIFRSTAAAEQLWPHAKAILCDTRKKPSPNIFESILFLRFKCRFWRQRDVSTALRRAGLPLRPKIKRIIPYKFSNSELIFLNT